MPVRTVRPWLATLLLVSPIAAMAQQEAVAPAGSPSVETAVPMPPAAAPGAAGNYAPGVAPMPQGTVMDPGYGQMMDPAYGQMMDPAYGQMMDPAYGAAMMPGYGPAMTPDYGQMPYGYGAEQMNPGMMMPQMMPPAGQYPEMADPYGMQRPAMPGMGRGMRAGQSSAMPQREAFHRSMEAKLDEILGRLERIEQMLHPATK